MVQPGLPNPPGGMMTGQGSEIASQTGFSSMASQRSQFGNMNMLGNVPNVSSLLHQSFPNGASNPGSLHRGHTDNGSETDPISSVGNGMGFNQSSSLLAANTSGQVHGQQLSNMLGNQMLPDPQHSQHLDPRNFQHNQQQVLGSNGNQPQQHQQFQTMRAGLGGAGPVKMDPHMVNDQTFRNLNNVKLEPHLQGMRSLAHMKMEPHHTDSSMFLQQHQQQQQQQLLQLSRQNPQAAAILQQQRFMQLQQQQQQQQQHNILKATPPQRSPLQTQLTSQNLPMRSPVKPIYEPGMCALRLTHYMHQQKNRPKDNNIEFWRKFVTEFFAPNAKKRWCVSMYGSGRQTTGVLPQDVWHCEICNCKPGRGFEATIEVLPRLFKIKYESGTLDELLHLDMPREYHNSSGQIVLDYAKAVQQSFFENLQVIRNGQLRLVFSSDLKICSWEFCARHHEEFIPKKSLVPQVNQFGVAMQNFEATQNSSSNTYLTDLENNRNMFASTARQLTKTVEVPLVNDLGYTKRYVRSLQISEVVNSMKDLIDFSRENKIGPIESLAKFPRKSNSSAGICSQQRGDQQAAGQNSSNNVSHPNQEMKLASSNDSLNTEPTGSSASAIARLMHQNSMNSRQQNLVNGSNGVQMPSPGSSIPQSQPNLSPFQSPSPSTTNYPPHASHGGMSADTHINSACSPNISIQQPALSADVAGNDSQSSVQKIIHDIMLSSNLGGAGGRLGTASMGNDVKILNGTVQTNNNPSLNGNGDLIDNGTGFGSMANGFGQSTMFNGIQAGSANNSMGTNGRMGVSLARNQSMNQRNQMLSGPGNINGFNNLQFNQ